MPFQPCADPDLSDIVENWPSFDAAWYGETYHDVRTSHLSPAQHYQRFGQWMRRGISASEPDSVRGADLIAALRRKPVISYCVPIMHRPDDIKATLPANLEENRPFQDQIEFIVIFFDNDDATHDWVRRQFPGDLASGYLRLLVSPALMFWHFGRAKNAFSNRLVGRIYSSLDGDNFVTHEETDQLLGVARRHGRRFLFHHFSGRWGDGTSGRVSMPRELYQAIGYEPLALPRQYDEMDLILTTLARYSFTRLIRYDVPIHCLSSPLTAKFAAEVGLDARPHTVLEQVRRRQPENPRGETYLNGHPDWMAMTKFNQLFCYHKNATPGAMRNRYLQDIHKARHDVIDTLPRHRLIPTLVSPQTDRSPPQVQNGDVSLFCCVKNDDSFLDEFYHHYKTIGVAHFFVIDDHSDIPVGKTLPYADVHVFQPQAGSFATAKGMWLEALIARFLEPGMWALTVDVDEFLDVPAQFGSVGELAAVAAERKRTFVPGLLLDMLPPQALTPQAVANARLSFTAAFPNICAVPGGPNHEYLDHNSIRWGFGDHASLPWAFDARFHAFGTFDSLRKIPLIRTRAGLHINQGFHDLHFTDGSCRIDNSIWTEDIILPIRHYKLAKLFFPALRAVASRYMENYHPRTAENIATIFDGKNAETTARLLALPQIRYTLENFSNALIGTRVRSTPSATQ